MNHMNHSDLYILAVKHTVAHSELRVLASRHALKTDP